LSYIDFDDEDAFYTKEERRARRRSRQAAMTFEEKARIFWLRLSTFFIAVLGNYGAYSFARFVEEYTGFPSFILGLLLFVLICWGAFYAPMENQRKLRDEIDRVNYDHKQGVQHLNSALERDKLFIAPFVRASKVGTNEEKAFISALVSKYSVSE
jgi:hypothetical protein